ncbi:solute carrier family 49 member 4 homolog [Diadema antillarum]|uniref:solute carrier family 49 member 4 homolog n=1 Tax=Diadema antillarum TaxID=105358 RepID=UPI003A88DB5C
MAGYDRLYNEHPDRESLLPASQCSLGVQIDNTSINSLLDHTQGTNHEETDDKDENELHDNQEISGRDTNVCRRNQTQSDSAETKTVSDYVVYSERWYILAIFSFIAFLQACTWNTWGPIEDTAAVVLGWNPGQFALLANWGPITFIISAFFFSWLLHAKGLRASVLLTGGLLTLGLAIRCIPVPVSMMKWTMNLGHVFIGLAGPVSMAAPTTISAAWFPVRERTTATAISATFQIVGIAASFLIGPQIVGDFTSGNNTSTSTIVPTFTSGGNFSVLIKDFESDEDEINQHLTEIKELMFIEFSLTALVFVSAVIYFPSKPPTPPTASAFVKREDMKAGLIAIVKKMSFWVPALAYAITTGVFAGWSAQLVALFTDKKLDQTSIAWIGFYTNLAAVVGGITAGRCADYLGGKMKAILLFLVTTSCAFLLWTILLVNDYIPYSKTCVYVSIIMFGLFLNSCVPLFYEITVEGAFPVGEETATIFMTWLNNVWALIFLIMPMIPALDKNFGWLNWFMLASVVITVPLLLFYKEHYNRLDFDVTHSTDRTVPIPETSESRDQPPA